MTKYKTVMEQPNSTVVAEYKAQYQYVKKYQSEGELEAEFIKLLQSNGYEHLQIKNSGDLLANLRKQLEKLNNALDCRADKSVCGVAGSFKFSDGEWQQILNSYLANKNEGIVEKTRKIQEDFIYTLKRADASPKNIYIIDKNNIHNNFLQVINQYSAVGTRKNRYDVTVLVNGLPLVHIELKRRGVSIKEAFNQINRYQYDSFWAESGLYEFVQLFVISNGTHTKYYSNTVRRRRLKEQSADGRGKSKKTSNSFEFTSWWADAKNKRIADLMDFGKTFFSKHALLALLTRYCVFTTEKDLLVMRPYQIAATEQILSRIEMSKNLKQLGTVKAGGFIWHTTGSGKTLTSFKAAQLASKSEFMDKVLFVVDRKDLDYQTMVEYDRFEKGAANSNTSTKVLSKQLEDHNVKIIITTIQKLDRFIKDNKAHAVFNRHVTIIFDECHRSQFGDMHNKIIKSFKNYHIFGFTGTPIFAANSSSGGNPQLKTTEQAFGDKLHSYTIMDAIIDENVLPFRIDYVNTLKIKEDIKDKKVSAIDIKRAESASERITEVVKYICEHFDQKTKRNQFYKLKDRSMAGFNSIFAVSSIEAAKLYYLEFKKQIADLSAAKKLKIALIYSFVTNEDEVENGILPDEDFDTARLDKSSRDFLDDAIKDYNVYFKTNFDTSSDKFENYYKDVSQRVKRREVDLLIVCNMFLTGFDATTVNTLWVDKNLRQHGLLQAFSRTNRILNSVKTFGNIICFRDLENATNEAIALFGDKDACGIVLLKSYKEYYEGFEKGGKYQRGYIELIAELKENFPLPVDIAGEQAEKDFIKLYGDILKVQNILTSFDEFAGNEILSIRDFQDYQSSYIDLYQKLRKSKDVHKENINDDIVFEMELIKQIEINVDYILNLIAKCQEDNIKGKEILNHIEKAINSSIELRSKRELIENFIATINNKTNINDDWKKFAGKQQAQDLDKIIKEERLEEKKTKKFIEDAFRDGEIREQGTAFANILPPVDMFTKDNALAKKRSTVLEKLKVFFEKYFGI